MTLAAATTYALPGGFAAILAIGYLGYRLIRQETRASEAHWTMAQYELAVQRRENRVCNRRLAMVIEDCNNGGIKIRPGVWTDPEEKEPPVPKLDDGK